MTDRIDTAKEREKLVALEGHTPGPWRSGLLDSDLNREAALRRGIIKEGEYFGYAVCPEPWEGLSVALMPACDADHSKDAELVAAAPDLLASNRRLLDALDAERAENERLREAASSVEEWWLREGMHESVGGAPAAIFQLRSALNPEGEATSGSSKRGPQFPPSSCTAYQDCAHDGVCHDPNCGAPSQHGEGKA